MDDNNGQFDTGNYPGPGGKDKQPWFGQKRFGYGFGPRTWQGYLVTAILAVFAVVVATVTKGRMPDLLFAIIPVIVIPFIIRWIQSR
jgi:hypothetical protein